ncbi:transposase [Acidipropionibacterium jensenii]|uniref:transposase n=1 Tax=Acidipropionibacterium jensenii TaxID=1749 RepID=UPI000FD8377B|nr:transposase [Acidipropionibacterium jensenii]
MVDLAYARHGRTHTRLLDRAPGRSDAVYMNWFKQRGDTFRARIRATSQDPLRGYKKAIDDQLAGATHSWATPEPQTPTTRIPLLQSGAGRMIPTTPKHQDQAMIRMHNPTLAGNLEEAVSLSELDATT